MMKIEDSQCQEGIAWVRVIPLNSSCEVMQEQEFFWEKGRFPARSSSLCSVEGFLVCKERNGSAKPARHRDTCSQHNMTLSGKFAEGGPVTENVNILVDGRQKMQAIALTNEELPKIFQSFNFILKGLGCWRRHIAVSKECYQFCRDVNQN